MMESFICAFCAQSYPVDPFQTFCPTCHEPLLYAEIRKKKEFHFKYEHSLEILSDFLPLLSINTDLSLGEGNTPLICLKNIEKKFKLPPLFAKNETVNPTHSFKDRGTVVAVQKAISLGFQRIGTVSTGNMAASTAAYGARASLKTFVLVKEDTTSEKLAAAGIYNPVLIKVRGDYGELFRTSFLIGKKNNIYFMNSVDPFRIEGYKATGFEIFLQHNRVIPDFIFVPVSSGGHLIGIMRAFQDLKQYGFTHQYPTFIGVQAEGCSPIASAFEKNRNKVERIRKAKTIAHAISNPDPPAGNLLLRMIREMGGVILSVSDEKILEAQRLFAELEGIFVQPASATTLAGLLAFKKQQKLKKDSAVVLILTGSGLKSSSMLTLSNIRIQSSSLSDLSKIIKSV
jgi:threonine synthase